MINGTHYLREGLTLTQESIRALKREFSATR
jgi:hypothetical protein